jgi:trans-4-hydroxy-L-proline dehydratase
VRRAAHSTLYTKLERGKARTGMKASTTRPQLHDATQRVQRLREVALSHDVSWPFERDLYGGESLMASADDRFWVRRRGKAVAHILQNATVIIGPDELIVGRPYIGEPSPAQAERLEESRRYLQAQPLSAGQTGHQAVDIPKLLRLGARGIQQQIRDYRNSLNSSDPDDLRHIAFYDAAEIALDGLCDYAERNAAEAARLADEETDATRRQELLEISERCRMVPAHPARTFAEALQAVSFVNSTLQWAQGAHLICPGHPDRWLYHFYKNDIADGKLTPAQAQELIDCFNIQINETVPRGLAIGTMVGGKDPDGNDVTNEISYMCLQSIRNVSMSYPGLGICWHEGTPEELLTFGCEILAERGANPAIFNQDVISGALQQAGVTPEEACEFQNSTCVEITPVGASNVWVASPYFNLSQHLLDLLEEVAAGRCDVGSFNQLIEAYQERLSGAIAEAVSAQNANRYSTMWHRNFPLQSCFVRDCIERGMDIEWGGARYNWIECSFVGLANLVDSLAVIREFIYEQGSITVAALVDILRADFAGHEEFRQRVVHQVPSYGNDEAEVDALAGRITRFLAAECAKHEVVLGGGFKPGFFCWVMHERLGSETMATPDGRRAGMPFADGAGPAQGRERKGPTAAVKSTCSWDHTPMLGGLVLNLKFSPDALAGRESRAKLAELIKTYMRLGGFEVQINVVSRETLLAARERPDQYRDLVVRVAGYTDYFNNLSAAMQEEIIARTEFDDV